MNVTTTRFGTMEVPEYEILNFPSGIIRFRAPVVINPATRVGRQVLTLEELPIQYALAKARHTAMEYAR